MHSYTALLHQVSNRHYRVTFPDFIGIAGTAISLELVRPMAEAILANQLEEMRANGVPLPDPIPLHEAMADQFDAVALLIQVEPLLDSCFHTHIEESRQAAA